MSKRGFTLIELLVAISIIGVIFGIIITSAGAIQRAGRNTQRQTDLRNLQSALQQYYADKHSYPVSLSDLSTPKSYISKIPTDPSGGSTSYFYQFQSQPSPAGTASDCTVTGTIKCNYYYLCASIEGDAPASAKDCVNSSYNFQLTPD